MAPFATIYSYPGFRVQRAQLAAELNGLEVVLAEGFEMGKTNKTPEYLEKFPMGKVPGLETTDDAGKPVYIAESLAILNYVASKGPMAEQLLGSTPEEKAKIQQWTLFAENELIANMLPPWMMTILKMIPYDEAAYNKAIDGLKRALDALETVLSKSGTPFMLGDKMTTADIACGSTVFFAVSALVDKEMREGKTATMAWLDRLGAMPEFAKIFGEMKLADTRPGKPE